MTDAKMTTQSGSQSERTLEVGTWTVNYSRRDVAVDGKYVDMTDKEFEIVAYLAERRGEAVNRADLFQAVWGYEMDFNSNSLEVYIYRIRNKVGKPGSRRTQLKTVRSYGYRLDV